jgi:hypothetical protein
MHRTLGSMRRFEMTVLASALHTTNLTPRAAAHRPSGFGNDVQSSDSSSGGSVDRLAR